jgi:hypothetical protein
MGLTSDFSLLKQDHSPPSQGDMPNVAVQKLNGIFIGFGSVLSRNCAQFGPLVGRIKRREKAHPQAKRWLD